MKSYMLLSIVLFGLRLVLYSQTQCQLTFGSPIHTKQASYYCHQYVKGALLGNLVDMATGLPTSSESNFLNYSGEVATDPNFIQVCVNDAKAIVPSPQGNTAYHSAIKLSNGIFTSTPDASSQSIYSHQSATAFTTACPQDVQYYSTIPNVTISGTSATNQGMQFTLTLTNNGQPFPSFVQLADFHWFYNETGNFFTEVPGTKTAPQLL
ncbi:MAG: hypothetical protein JNL53_20105 [Cyclobacteriaceae bacterium]|nr:hypothetical protein [Cyclobacteriaceae bacterium]